MTRTFDDWLNLSRIAVFADRTDTLHDRIATECLRAQRNGEVPSVWHALSVVTGKRCHCVPCERARARE